MLLQLAARLLWPARCAACNAFVPEDQPFCQACALSVVSLGWEPWEGSQTLPRGFAAGEGARGSARGGQGGLSVPKASGLPTRLEQACPGCGLPLPDMDDGLAGGCRCQGCRAKPLPFSRVWAVLAYGGATTEAILHLKHGRRRHLARPLGALLAPAVAAAIDSGVNALCPVALHPRRLRQRGFNQALELLRVAERLARRPAARPLVFPDGLRRIRDTPALGWESPASRRRIVDGAFSVQRPGWAKGRRILLVDDVMTTGATLAECTRVLLKAGAAEVQVMALARVI